MDIYAVANQKGGVLKSTTSLALSILLSRKGQKVLLIDLDPQHSLSKTFCNDNRKSENSVYNVLLKTRNIKDCAIALNDSISFIPTDRELEDAQMDLMDAAMLEDYLLKEALEELDSDIDAVIIDCPPNNTYLNSLAIHAATTCIIPEEFSEWSNDGTNFIVDSILEIKEDGNPDLEKILILASSKNRRPTLQRRFWGDKEFNTFMDQLKAKYNNGICKVSDVVIPFDEQATTLQAISAGDLQTINLQVFDKYNKFIQENL